MTISVLLGGGGNSIRSKDIQVFLKGGGIIANLRCISQIFSVRERELKYIDIPTINRYFLGYLTY